MREQRKARSLTQLQLADRAGLSSDTIRRVEGDTLSPSLSTMERIAQALEVSLPTLLQQQRTGRRDVAAEVQDLLSRRSRAELALIQRLLRALFARR